MHEIKKNVLIGMIIGDALGSALDGLGPGHIHAHFKEIHDYVDPSPALKGKIELWKKPGFYSSISQFAIIAAASREKAIMHELFRGRIVSSPDVNGQDWGIFRYPDIVEKKFIHRVKRPDAGTEIPAFPSVRIISSSMSLSGGDDGILEDARRIISYVRLFTSDASTTACAISISALLRHLMIERPRTADYVKLCIESNRVLMQEINSNPGIIFSSSLNPDALMRELNDLNEILAGAVSARNRIEAEAIICSCVNKRLKTPIKRATVNIPLAMIPYALVLSDCHGQEPGGMFPIAMEGGHAAALTALTGALRAGVYGPAVLPEALVQNLANRKKILSLVDALSGDARPSPLSADIMEDFIQAEASLTAKSLEELAAKLKHIKKKPKRAMSQNDRETRLSQIVVESWTKADKAKWKKERGKLDKKRRS